MLGLLAAAVVVVAGAVLLGRVAGRAVVVTASLLAGVRYVAVSDGAREERGVKDVHSPAWLSAFFSSLSFIISENLSVNFDMKDILAVVSQWIAGEGCG